MNKYRFTLITSIIFLSLFLNIFSFNVFAAANDSVILSNFEVIEADIRDVFRSLAEIGNYNVLLDPNVKGQATIKLKNGLLVKQAIEYLAQTYGYSYRWVNETRTVLIGDEKTFQNFIMKETKVYRLRYGKAETLAAALSVVVAKEQIGADNRTNQLTIKASILEHQNIAELIARLDRLMPQINIDVRIEEVSSKYGKELGIDWDFNTNTSPIRDFEFNPVSLATLQALEDDNKAKLIANPNVSVTDSEQGRIFLGDRVPIITTSQTDKGIEYQVDYIEVGTKLEVTPRINDDNTVTVTVLAEVASITDWKNSGGSDVPLIRTREASSVVRLKDGQTFVLSGLNFNYDYKQKAGIPYLSRVPIIGTLFFGKSKVGNNEDTEIMIFITPRVVSEPKDELIGTNQNNIQKEDKTQVTNDSSKETAPINEEKVDEDQIDDQVEEIPEEASVENEPFNDQIEEEESEEEPLVSETDEDQVIEDENLTSIHQIKYVVKTGDTIDLLCKKFGVKKDNIKNVQSSIVLKSIKSGQTIIIEIPKSHLYTLKPKETLWRLSKRYGTTVELLKEINNISDISNLAVGQIIILPVDVTQIVDGRF